MRLLLSVAFILQFLIACTQKKSMDELKIIDGKAYELNSDSPFTGVAYETYPSGLVSAKINVINGIPNGKFTSYGYQGEILQTGSYEPFFLRNSNISFLTKIKRINILTFKEINYLFYNITIISDKTYTGLDSNLTFVNALKDSLKANHIHLVPTRRMFITVEKYELNK